MKIISRTAIGSALILALLFLTGSASAQSSSDSSANADIFYKKVTQAAQTGGGGGSVAFSTSIITSSKQVTGAPYSAQIVTESVQPFADGNSITHTSTSAVYRDSLGRTLPSRLINGLLRRFTGVPISDFGCAFNAYRREAIEPLLGTIGKQKFTKALVLASGASVEEVDVAWSPARHASRYSPLRLVRLALHVVAGFWPQPVQWIGVALGLGGLVALALETFATRGGPT